MAEKDKYIIKVEGKLVEVTPEVYYAYFRMERQERGQEEKKQQHDVISYDALDNCETVGMEAMPDVSIPSVEDGERQSGKKADFYSSNATGGGDCSAGCCLLPCQHRFG